MQATPFFSVSAKDEPPFEVIRGLSATIPWGGGEAPLPKTVQLFPPGKHRIFPESRPEGLDVTVNEKVADVVRADFLEMFQAAERGNFHKPYIDFNHEDREASAWVTGVVWAGEDPISGGVRATVEWTSAGEAAIRGKTFRSFSPNFRVAKDSGDIAGVGRLTNGLMPNMGGLVNRPAFRHIEPLFARDGDGRDTTPKETKEMNKLHMALVAAGLLSALPTDDNVSATEFTKNFGELQARLGKSADLLKTNGDLEIKAKETESKRAGLQAELDLVKAKAEKLAKKFAQETVAGWVTLGLIAAKDDAGKATWEGLLVADPENTKLMEPVIKAFEAKGGKVDPSKRIITPQSGNNGEQDKATLADGDHAFSVKAREIAEKKKISESEAIVVAARENPKMYDAYRAGLLYVESK